MIRKLMTFTAAVAAYAITTGVPAAAQEVDMGAEEQLMMEKWTEYATPGEEHAHLAQLEGAWNWTARFWMAPGDEPMESSGTSSSEMAFGGRYLIEGYEGSAMGQPFEGHGMTGYDNRDEEYIAVWVDNHSTGVMISRGSYDPATRTLTMTGTYDDVVTGEEKTMRGVTTIVDDDTVRYEAYTPGPDGVEFKSFELVSTRQP
ncbi:MAG TPA: DUF1579 domain-containing protein [Gemmatimonadota bacterium]|nr:DUF1579 domain-containing protein [Gemmatimonadota bacterium]